MFLFITTKLKKIEVMINLLGIMQKTYPHFYIVLQSIQSNFQIFSALHQKIRLPATSGNILIFPLHLASEVEMITELVTTLIELL